MAETIIALKSISKVFQTKERRFTALDNINLRICKGDSLAVIGKSGSGKSTLINMITGIDYPSQGTITFKGEDLAHMNESQLAQWRGKNIGIVFQFFQLIPTLTISENLLLAMEFVNAIPKPDRFQRANELLSHVGIEEHADKLPAALSGGEQQRAAIARALANDPEIIIADEPTGNLDSKTAKSIDELFKSLSDLGKTVIVITHDANTALKYDRTITLHDGKIVSPNQIH